MLFPLKCPLIGTYSEFLLIFPLECNFCSYLWMILSTEMPFYRGFMLFFFPLKCFVLDFPEKRAEKNRDQVFHRLQGLDTPLAALASCRKLGWEAAKVHYLEPPMIWLVMGH